MYGSSNAGTQEGERTTRPVIKLLRKTRPPHTHTHHVCLHAFLRFKDAATVVGSEGRRVITSGCCGFSSDGRVVVGGVVCVFRRPVAVEDKGVSPAELFRR